MEAAKADSTVDELDDATVVMLDQSQVGYLEQGLVDAMENSKGKKLAVTTADMMDMKLVYQKIARRGRLMD